MNNKKNFRKVLAVSLAMTMLAGTGFTTAGKYVGTNVSVSATKVYGEFEYAVNSDDTITIEQYTGNGGDVTIPDTIDDKNIVCIGNKAFYNCNNITSVVLPNNLETIGKYAFCGCSSIKKILLPITVSEVSLGAFQYCSALEDITTEREDLIIIGNDAFLGTKWYDNQADGMVYFGATAYKYKNYTAKVWSLSLKDGTKGIAESAFSNCSYLRIIDFPDSLEYIGGSGLNNTKWLKEQEDGVVYAGSVAYSYKGIMPENTHIVLKDGTKGIAENAFFNEHNMVGITIPDSVKIIGRGAFYWCTGLTEVVFPTGLISVGGTAFTRCSKLNKIVISDTVSNIGTYAFFGCDNLKNVSIPQSVEKIGERAFGYHDIQGSKDEEKIDDFVIYGKVDSIAQKYAKNNDFRFVPIYDPSEIRQGDTNSDGSVDIADALMIARADAGLIQLDEMQLAVSDVNKDNSVDIADALMVARFDAGLITAF